MPTNELQVKRRLCRDCRDAWKRTRSGKRARAEVKRSGVKLKTFYPEWVYHHSDTRFCPKHHAQRLAWSARRRANKKNATPPWADHKRIKSFYEEAVRISEETGVKHHVDHIIPLQHPLVCGLHVAANLRVIPGHENIRKNNHFKIISGLEPNA